MIDDSKNGVIAPSIISATISPLLVIPPLNSADIYIYMYIYNFIIPCAAGGAQGAEEGGGGCAAEEGGGGGAQATGGGGAGATVCGMCVHARARARACRYGCWCARPLVWRRCGSDGRRRSRRGCVCGRGGGGVV
jgi:hypothetical protein